MSDSKVDAVLEEEDDIDDDSSLSVTSSAAHSDVCDETSNDSTTTPVCRRMLRALSKVCVRDRMKGKRIEKSLGSSRKVSCSIDMSQHSRLALKSLVFVFALRSVPVL